MINKVKISGNFVYPLVKGENTYQSPAALYSLNTPDPLSLDKFRLITGDSPGFTNLCGLDRLVQILCRCVQAFRLNNNKVPFIVIAAKHGNPCGLAIDWQQPENAIEKAMFGNPLAIWGGEVIVNFPLTDDLAFLLIASQKRKALIGSGSWMLDIIAAPKVTSEAKTILGKRGRRKLFVNPALSTPTLDPNDWTYRFTRGSFILQPPPNYVLNLNQTEFIPGKHQLTPAQLDSLLIAWAVAFNSMHGGNEVAFAKNRALISCGGGPSTIEAAQLAVFKAKNQHHSLKKSIFAADAFFPFTDVPALLAKTGVIAGSVPSGGQAFPQVKDYFANHHISMYYLKEEYRGFCFH